MDLKRVKGLKMKTIKSILLSSLIFVSSISHAGLPPTTIKGQLDALKSTTFNFVVPNHQVTKTGDGSLIETGNKDWLKNPNFEAAIDSSDGSLVGWERNALWVSWVNVGSGLQSSGKLGIKLSVSATTYAAGDLVFQSDEITPTTDNVAQNLSGILWIKSANAGYQLCAKRTVSGTSSCTDIVADSTRYIEYKTPIFSGGDSSESYRLGIYHKEARSLASIEDIFVDDGKLGPTDIAMGTVENTFTANISSAGVVSLETGPTMDWINGSCSVSDTSLYTCTFNSGIFPTSQPNCNITPYATDLGATETSVSIEAAGTSNTQLRYRTEASGAKAAFSVKLSCTRTGSDYIQGARVSDGYDNQDVVLSGTGTSTTAFTTTPTTVTFNTNIKDTTNSYSSGVYTVKSNGSYPVEAQLDTITGTYPAGGTVVLAIYKNSTEVYSSFSRNPTGSSAVNLAVPPKVSGTVDAVAGDTISIKAYGASGLTSFTAGSSTYTYISIFKKSGAAYISPMAGEVKSTAGNLRVLTGRVTSLCTSSPCTVANSVGGVASVTRSGTGSYSINATPAFGGQFQCFIRCSQTGTSGNCVAGGDYSSNTTGFGFLTYRGDTNTAVDSTFQFMCIGPQ